MIYLGYDFLRQQCVASYKGDIIVCQNTDRADQILDGLCAVGEKLSRPQDISHEEGGVEVVAMVQMPWAYTVKYSDQAWSDLLSVQEFR